MGRLIRDWWDRLRVRQKVWIVVLVLCLPLLAALAVHVTLVQRLLDVQHLHEQTFQARGQVRILQRLSVDITSAFRGYLLTQQEEFLKPMDEAGSKLEPTIAYTIELIEHVPSLSTDIRGVSKRLAELLESKRVLIRQAQAGRMDEVMRYVRSGQGIALSDSIRNDLQVVEDKLDLHLKSLDEQEARLARQAFWGLLLAVVCGLALGLFSAWVLTRSITKPLARLQASVTKLGEGGDLEAETRHIRSSDEIGQLARSYEEMAGNIRRYIRELETINEIGNEINTIGPDGLDGVLRRITERAAEMLSVDVCMVMLRDDVMGCWVVEAASGHWHERLRKTVMLWEEFPMAVESFETGHPAVGENLRGDQRPEVVRRNLMGQSLLSLPLLSQGKAFGVLILVLERMIPRSAWNLRLAKGFAEEAAIAVANARLYEAAKQKGKGLQLRLKHLEHLAEMLAHDMKAPGERMEGLSTLLLSKYEKDLEPEAARLLALIQENGKILSGRIETILEFSRVGAGHDAVEAVDPSLVISEVLKERAGELEKRKVRVHVASGFPLVACHRAYLRQVFDNLISNAMKYAGDRSDPEIHIETTRRGETVEFRVSDNGCGIPPQYRERVFDPFFRLDPQAQGSGIGLTIVKRIVELYNGQVWVDPGKQEGCTVAFTLPVLGDLTTDNPSEGVRW